MKTYEVIVAGLGPTGLTLAHLLGRAGISVLVLEREPEFYGNARAVYTDDEALRVLQTAGVADALHADMNVDSTVQWISAKGRPLVQFRTLDRPQGWPVTNFLYQPYFEDRMAELLAAYPHVEVRRGREVTGFTQDASGVTVEHARATGSGYGRRENTVDETTGETARGAFLVGADGGRSIVRMSLGIDMSGRSYPERWLVVDLASRSGADAFRHLPYFDFICDPVMPVVSCPQPGGHHRFEFALTDDDATEDFEDDATVRALIGRYVDPDRVEVKRHLVYTFNAVVADRWREGRILLAGDAAHMTPQFIGQGMNSGIRDADNLAWKLHAILRHGADLSVLDSYESERRTHAQAMIDLSVFNKSLVSLKNPAGAAARDAALSAAMVVPGLRGWLRRAGMKPKPKLPRGRFLGLPRPLLRGIEGTLAPQPEVRHYDGRPARLDDALGAGWAVIGFEVDPREVLGARRADWDRVDARYAVLYRAGTRPQATAADALRAADLVDVEDIHGLLTDRLRKAGHRPGTLLVLRPDRYVFGASPDPAALTDALIDQLGLRAAGRAAAAVPAPVPAPTTVAAPATTAKEA